MMTDFQPITVNGYTLNEEIGSGGYGVVYKSVAPDGRVCAVKHVKPQPDDANLLRRLEMEAQIIRDLQHPQIVRLYDYWQDEAGVWLVMSWLPTDLRRYIAQYHPLPAERLVSITDDIAAALSAAHAADIIHRDLKPDNILLDEAGRAYLTDFGIAKRLGYAAVTSMGLIIGSPAYLTPEQILGDPITPRTDVFAFGLMLYEMLCNAHPFEGIKSHIQLMLLLAQSKLPDAHAKRPDISPAVSAVIHKATIARAEERYESVLALASALRQALQEGG